MASHVGIDLANARASTSRLLVLAVFASTVFVVVSTGVASAVSAEPTPGVQHRLGPDGVTEPVYDFDDAIIEHVYVRSEMDSDRDGRLDLVRADIIRPATAPEERVPAIITASGYYGTPGGKPYADDLNRDRSDLLFMPDIYDNYFVPRGYAFLSVDVAGTNWSEGCVDNVGPNDVESVAAVVRWLSGAPGAVAYTALDRAEPVTATGWSSGHSAVTGVSYDGGIANAVATSANVPGLETVVPIAGGSSAYNTRPHGVFVGGGTAEFAEWLTEPEPAGTPEPTLPPRLREHQAAKRVQCQADFDTMRAQSDPTRRTYNDFWRARNYTTKVDQIAANGVSVFAATGQGDMIVRTNEFDQHWAALQRAGVESKLWLHLRGHIDPFAADHDRWMSDLHRWFDHELMGVDNGIVDEPAARVEVGPDEWVESATWPVPGSTMRTVRLGGAGDRTVGTLAPRVATQSTAGFDGAQLVDAAPFALTAGAAAPAPGTDRLVYVTEPFERDTRISGTPSVTLRVAPEAGDTNVSVALVDYGPATRVDWTDGGVKGLPTSRTWGSPNEFESMLIADTRAVTREAGSYVFTRGTASTAHHRSLTTYTPVPTGHFVDLTWDLFATDHVVPAGHRVGLVVFNNSIQLDPGTVGDYVGTAGSRIDEARSTLRLPTTVVPRADWTDRAPARLTHSPQVAWSFGQPSTLEVAVGTDGGVLPAGPGGAIEAVWGGRVVASAPVDSQGRARLTMPSSWRPATYRVGLRYSGSTSTGPAASGVVATVGKARSTLIVSAWPQPIPAGRTATLGIEVGNSSGAPYNGTATLVYGVHRYEVRVHRGLARVVLPAQTQGWYRIRVWTDPAHPTIQAAGAALAVPVRR